MKSQWETNQEWGYHMFGHTTDNRLRNTNGIYINQYGGVDICHFDEDGSATKPQIYCDEDDFEILE